jgi:hypothetical protein
MSVLRGRPRWSAALVIAACAALGACNFNVSNRAEARDQWQRHYTLTQGGTFEIRNTNGLIRIEPGDGDAIDVTADRIVQAATDQAAKDGLAKFEFQENVTPNQITIDSSNKNMGLTIGLSRRVEYHIKLPRWTNIKLDTTNGDIEVAGPRLTGTFHAEATNGRIQATGLENSVTVETTNGAITLDVNKLGDSGITCDTTNGAISITVPNGVAARVSARVTNGTVSQDGLQIAVSEQSRHRLDGTLGGGGPLGGPMIKLETTNGRVQLKGK